MDLALPLRKDFPPLRGKMSRSDKRGNLLKPQGFDREGVHRYPRCQRIRCNEKVPAAAQNLPPSGEVASRSDDGEGSSPSLFFQPITFPADGLKNFRLSVQTH